MEIKIKHIALVNFKGIHSFEAAFNGQATTLRGDNGTGKTTLFDAFTWCLYGKDSAGRSDANFQLRTLDADNKPIERMPHEVTVTLTADGEEIELRRCFVEDWKKKRGQTVETYTGNHTDRYWNGVPMTEREYNEKLAQICPEDVFALITSPTAFLTLPKKEQRAYLIRWAGDITPQGIAAKNVEFAEVVKAMGSKTIDEYTKEMAVRLKRTKEDAANIPARIDERKRSIPAAEDWTQIETAIADKRKELDIIDSQLTSQTAAYEGKARQLAALMERKATITAEQRSRETSIRANAQKAIDTRRETRDTLLRTQREKQTLLQSLTASNQEAIRNIEQADKKLDSLRAAYHTIRQRTFKMDESQCVCPTCQRRLEEARIEELREEMAGNFNAETARLLADNKRQGQSRKQERDNWREMLEQHTKEAAAIKEKLEDIASEIARCDNTPIPDPTPELESDPVLLKFADEANAIEKEIEAAKTAEPDTTALRQQRAEAQEALQQLRDRLGVRSRIDADTKRIAELQDQLKALTGSISDTERTLDTLAALRKAMMQQVEQNINDRFKIVRFKMYELQINGGERETCEALVEGVPYSTNLNTAARINAGLDVINAISSHYHTTAPVFIDNRETVTRLIPTDSQIINLYKDEAYKQLTLIEK